MLRTPDPRSVCILITSLGMGGAEKQAVMIANGLSGRGWRVTVTLMLPYRDRAGDLERTGIALGCLGMSRGVPSLRAALRLARMLRSARSSHLLTLNYPANILGRIVRLLNWRLRVVTSIRNENVGGHWRDLALRVTDRLGSATVANSRLAGEALVHRHVVPKHRLVVVPNAVDPSIYASRPCPDPDSPLRRGLCADPGAFLWLAVGRLERQKDYPLLLRSFRKVVELHPNARLAVAGEGPLRDELATLRASLGLDESVSLLGHRRDVPALMAAADALVLASAWEGLPNAVMEAMASCRPVVATRVGGVPELVQEGRTGLLARPQDEDDLVRAMHELMSAGPDTRDAMGVRARRHIEESCCPGRIIDQWERVLLGGAGC